MAAVSQLIGQGIGFSPGSVTYFVTDGFGMSLLPQAPTTIIVYLSGSYITSVSLAGSSITSVSVSGSSLPTVSLSGSYV